MTKELLLNPCFVPNFLDYKSGLYFKLSLKIKQNFLEMVASLLDDLPGIDLPTYWFAA